MKKIFLSLLLVISFLFLSGFTTLAESEVNVHAQATQPKYLEIIEYQNYSYLQENENTYEYLVTYTTTSSVPETIGTNDYFLFEKINIKFIKGIDRNTNSYEFDDKVVVSNITYIYFRVTILKSVVDYEYYGNLTRLFNQNTVMYINATNAVYDEYDRGYNDGYNEGYIEGYDEGYNEGYEDGRIIIVGRAPDNDYNFNNFGEPIIGTAYANRLYYSTGLGRVPVISNELFVGYNNIMIATFYGVFFYDSNGNEIGDIIINCGNTSSCENAEGYGEKFDYMANSIDFAYNFAIYLNKYDIDYENVEFVELQFITKQFPTAGWHEHFKNDLYFSFNYEHSFLRINLYQQGYNDGFEEGEKVGSGIATREAYELGYETGYKDGLKKANVDPFIANFDKWIVPAIIIVMLLGGYFAIRRQKTEE